MAGFLWLVDSRNITDRFHALRLSHARKDVMVRGRLLLLLIASAGML
tara:strand:- start:1 stop:141 length:141 start_codon:yes stop_codon:yes gene_type:complete